jgi:putative ABC transport system permease protein
MIRHYLSLSLKVFARRRFFTFVSLFGISFTLTVLMLVTALLDHAVAPFPPEVHQDRTLGIYFAMESGDNLRKNGGAGFKLLDGYMRNIPGVERMSLASYPTGALSYLNGTRVTSYLKRTDGEFWRIMRFDFLEGGPFTTSDLESHRMVAVINESTRRRFFGEGAQAVGRTIDINDQRFRIVGVVRDVPILRIVPFADVWVPFTTDKSDSYRQEIVGDTVGMGLLLARSRDDLPAIREEVRSRARRVPSEDPKVFSKVTTHAETLFETAARVLTTGGNAEIENPARRLWIALATLALLFMLLPAVNLVNLNVSRIMERASEIGVRKSFGASSVVLVGQFLVENIALTLIGGAIGLLAAVWLLWVVNTSGLILYADLRLNYRVFLAGLGFALFFGAASGVYPAWRMSRLNPVEALKGTPR